MKNYNLVARLKTKNITNEKRELKKLVAYVSKKYWGKDMCPVKTRMAEDFVSRVDDWSLLEAI